MRRAIFASWTIILIGLSYYMGVMRRWDECVDMGHWLFSYLFL